MEKNFEFLVDSREHHTIKSLVSKKGIPHRVTALNAGDFALRKLDPWEDLVGMERKAVADLVQSIQTPYKTKSQARGYRRPPRIFEQVKKLTSQYKIRYLLISGDLDQLEVTLKKRGLKINRPVIWGTLSSFAVRNDFNILWFPNDDMLIEAAYRICTKVSEGKYNEPIRVEPKYMSFNAVSFLAKIPGISQSIAEEILKKFGTLKNIANATSQQLSFVHGVGDSKAKVLAQFFVREHRK